MSSSLVNVSHALQSCIMVFIIFDLVGLVCVGGDSAVSIVPVVPVTGGQPLVTPSEGQCDRRDFRAVVLNQMFE